jgi:catechol 2,3-dioxygenase-like lactoylglutathione lyase family enzyme
MLADSRAVAFLAVADMKKARAFYEGVLGLNIVSDDEWAVVAEAGGVRIRITKPPQRAKADYTVLGFVVDGITAKMAALKDRGVSFELYPFFGDAQDAEGLWTTPGGDKVAWFRDPDGNLLSLSEHPGE